MTPQQQAEATAIEAAAATNAAFTAWRSAGDPAHAFTGEGEWCGECGCGPLGWQHQPGGTPPPPPLPWGSPQSEAEAG